jgi:hypothetical protein
MNLQELQQVKKDLADGVIVSRQKWEKVLEAAITNKTPAQEQDTVSIDQQFLAVANDVRFACMKLYSPDDTATDWADKMAELKLVPIIRAARAAQLAQSADTAEGDHA